MHKRNQWFTFTDVDGKLWTVFLTNRRANKLLGEGESSGVCYPELCLIEIECEEHSKEWQDTTLLHELLHAALAGLGLHHSTEERIVLRIEKFLWPILWSFGLRWPRRPRTKKKKPQPED